MNQTVKIFFTDMDDTLLNSEKQVTKENMDAISEALAAGHKIVFNTGRPLSGFLPILKELGLDREGCYAITFNGGLIYDCAAKKTLYRRTIPLEYARVIFEKTGLDRLAKLHEQGVLTDEEFQQKKIDLLAKM